MSVKQLAAGLSVFLLLTACATTADSGASAEKRQVAAAQIDSRIVKAGNDFGLRLHRELVQADPGANVFVSPVSVSMALGMAYAGSGGETRQAIAKTMGWDGMSLEEVNRANQALKRLLEQSGGGVQWTVANSLWLRKGNRFHRDFLQAARNYYEAEAAELDFADAKVPGTINGWVKKSTNGKIPAIIDERGIDPSAVLLLINAVYFKGGWTNEFPASATRDDSFKLVDGSAKQVRMMAKTGTFEYLHENGIQAVRLPYGAAEAAMLVMVPDETSSLDDLHEKLWSDPSPWQKRFRPAQGELLLPRFKLEYGQSLNEALKAMGMAVAFDRGKADFSGMAPVPPVLSVSEVKHKSFIEVNEKGTEAAAATSVGMAGSSPPTERFRMHVNRPFFFAIEDRQTGAWLFVGSVTEP